MLGKIESAINYVEGSEGSRVQPLAHASFDAWVKAYRPNENSSNTSMSYYSRGSIIATLLDVMIIENSKGEKCLDHFLQALYSNFYENKGRALPQKNSKKSWSHL